MTTATKTFAYWRNSLVDGYRLQQLDNELEVDNDTLQKGNIGPESAEIIKTSYRKALHSVREKGKETAAHQQGLPVLVCPVKLAKRYDHYQESYAGGDKTLIPLWIPALMDKNGELHPRDDQLPWIARDLLEPTTKKGATIGDIEDVEKFLTQNNDDSIWENWQKYWDYAIEMLNAMPEGEKLDLPGYARTGQSYIMPDVEVRGAAMNAIRVMDHLLGTKTIPPLLNRLARQDEAPEIPVLDKMAHLTAASKHCGQMGGEFPLSPSQRTALHYFLKTGSSEILAVNGPPGTGKTTLIHSAIASMRVQAALNRSQPPVILAVSANNQAVTNMIDSFGKVAGTGSDKKILSAHWIPEQKSYGLYVPSGAASQRQESKNYQKAMPGENNFPAQNGFPGTVEDSEFIDRAEKYYLEQCSKFTGNNVGTVKDATELLHKDLVYLVGTIREKLNNLQEQEKIQAGAESTVRDILEKYSISPDDDIEAKLDSTVSRYDTEKLNLQKELRDIQEKLNSANEKLAEMAALANAVKPINSTGLLGKIAGIFNRPPPKTPSMLDQLKTIISRYEAELAELSNKQRQVSERLMQKEAQIRTLNLEIATLKEIAAAITAAIEQQDSGTPESVYEKLDTVERYEAFLLANHYWEGQWLMEMRKMQELTLRKIYLSPEEKVINKWRRYAMLTPAIVSTLYVAPRMFTVWHREGEYLEAKPLLEFVDLLIVDEAGQVPPEIAAATFALAKKALVVGDVLQIEPVYNITRFVDQGNLIRHGLIQGREQYPAVQHMSASKGSLMAVAQKACPYWLTDEHGEKYPERGMFLSEHRRCLDTIISFCNQLAYFGRLKPMRGNDILPGALQHFNYLHVAGKSLRAGSSRKNEKEAIAILDWLLANQLYLQQKYGEGEKPVKELVAVLTPFTAQKKVFLQAVWNNKKYAPLRGIVFGTIHALQGAERDVVIFSPVYTRDDGAPGEFFYNTDIRMLNVAVSRAREAFVIIGDMEVFKKSGGPAGILAKYIFATPANNLAGSSSE